MKSLFIAFSAAVLLAGPAFALSPEAEAFVRSAGLDPQSDSVRAADQEGTIETTFRGDSASFSLEALAIQKKKNGVLAFVTTREFIKKLAANIRTPFPKAYYDGMYLYPAERLVVAQKIADGV